MQSEEELDIPLEEEEEAPAPRAPRKTKAEREREAKRRKKRRRNKSVGRVYGVLIMLTIIIVTSVALSVGIIEVGKDMIGIEGTQTLVPFTIPEGATASVTLPGENEATLYQSGSYKIVR